MNTNKAIKKKSALLRGIPLFKRSKGHEVVKEDVQTLPKDLTSTEVPITTAALRPEDIHSWMDLMTPPIEDLHLLSPEKMGLKMRSTPGVLTHADHKAASLGFLDYPADLVGILGPCTN